MIPDSRTVKRHTIRIRGREFEATFCANCGNVGGYITAEAMPFVFYVCDCCVEKHGKIAATEVPEEFLRGI